MQHSALEPLALVRLHIIITATNVRASIAVTTLAQALVVRSLWEVILTPLLKIKQRDLTRLI